MDECTFENALNLLPKSKEGSKLLKLLIIIRKNVEWPKNKDNITKLRVKGGLKCVIGGLLSPQKKTVDVCLSILGNCCMDFNAVREIIEFHVFSNIYQVLKKHGKDDSVNGRTFRVIGNICQHREQWANIIVEKKPQLIQYMVDYVKKIANDELEEVHSDATLIMGIRALREMLNNQTLISLVKTFSVLKAIGMLLIKYSPGWQKDKSHENILTNVIKLLQEYSRYKYYHSILEMRTTDKGDSLIHLSNILLLAPKKIVKIIMNFIRISQLLSDLPVPEICEKFIEVLEHNSIPKEFNGECVEYLQCLCYLLDHPANRNTERCNKSVPLLIKLLDDFRSPSNSILESCTLIICTLNKYKYESQILNLQLRSNIIAILISKLEWIGGSCKTLNLKHRDEKKKKYDFSGGSDLAKKLTISIDLDVSQDLNRSLTSPCSSDDDDVFEIRCQRSPSPSSSSESEMNYNWGSPRASPFLNTYQAHTESDSDDYSPVCSEADDAEFQTSLNDSESLAETNQYSDTEENTSTIEIKPIESTTKSILKFKLLSEIVKLLKTYLIHKPTQGQLCSEDLIFALVKCSGYFDWTYSTNVDTVDVVCRILDTYDYLLPLMQTDLISTIYSLTQVQHGLWCIKCKQYQHIGNTILKKFVALAESDVGKGDIANKLLKGNDAMKKKLVLTIPYIVRNKSILSVLMMHCKGLDILMTLLQDQSEITLQKKSIKVLCAMAVSKLAISNPSQQSSVLTNPKIVADKYEISKTCSNIVTFQLDDGSAVKADRDFLIEKSEYFRGLLSGGFRESTEATVELQGVNNKALRCLIHLLHCDIDTKTEVVEIELDLATLLEVISLTDRYLLIELCTYLTDCVQQLRITAETVPEIYKWSLESRTNLLRVESIAFALVANVDDSQRFVMFENLFKLGFSDELVDDIQKLLIRYLTQNCIRKRKFPWV